MTSTAEVVSNGKHYFVHECWGQRFIVLHGPYRFKFVAKIVAWFLDGDH